MSEDNLLLIISYAVFLLIISYAHETEIGHPQYETIYLLSKVKDYNNIIQPYFKDNIISIKEFNNISYSIDSLDSFKDSLK